MGLRSSMQILESEETFKSRILELLLLPKSTGMEEQMGEMNSGWGTGEGRWGLDFWDIQTISERSIRALHGDEHGRVLETWGNSWEGAGTKLEMEWKNVQS